MWWCGSFSAAARGDCQRIWDGPNSNDTFFKTYMLWHHLKNLHDVTPFLKHACGTKPHPELEWIYGLLASNSICCLKNLVNQVISIKQDALWSLWSLCFGKVKHGLKLLCQMWTGGDFTSFIVILPNKQWKTNDAMQCQHLLTERQLTVFYTIESANVRERGLIIMACVTHFLTHLRVFSWLHFILQYEHFHCTCIYPQKYRVV